MSRRSAWVIGAIIVVAVTIAGCGGSGSGGSGNATETNSAPAKPGGVLRIGTVVDPETLLPSAVLQQSAGEVASQINETLFRVNAAGKLIPQLATSFKMSADGLTTTIGIKEGVTFSTGKPLTAKDVVFSLDQARHSVYYASLYEGIREVKASSPYTVVIKTAEPIAALQADLSLIYAAIVPDHYGGVSEKEFAQHPIGSGPFEFVKWVHGESVTLAKNPHYWQPNLPLLNSVVFKIAPDGNSRLSQLRGGDIDVSSSVPDASLDSVENEAGMRLISGPPASVSLMLLNLRNPLFKDPRIREAINIAIDRKGINEVALAGRGVPGGSFLAPNLAPYTDPSIKPPARDVARAKQLVSEALKELNISPSFSLITWTGEPYWNTTGEIIQQNLDEIGFQVSLQPLEVGAALADIEAGEFDASVNGYYTTSPDPSENVTYYLGAMAEPAGGDTTEYKRLSDAAAATLNFNRRRKLYFELQELVAEQEESIIWGYRRNFWAMKDSVAGYEINPLSQIWLAKAGFSS